jgi:hypothetical protein
LVEEWVEEWSDAALVRTVETARGVEMTVESPWKAGLVSPLKMAGTLAEVLSWT